MSFSVRGTLVKGITLHDKAQRFLQKVTVVWPNLHSKTYSSRHISLTQKPVLCSLT